MTKRVLISVTAALMVAALVAVPSIASGDCQHLYASGRLSTPRVCAATHWIRANGTSSWRLPIPRPPPVGNRERLRTLHLDIR
jgi:hypothetical protein